MEPRGFLSSTVDAIRAGNPNHLGVQLGLRMLRDQWPVTLVANEIGISRTALYALIKGESYPKPETQERIHALLNYNN